MRSPLAVTTQACSCHSKIELFFIVRCQIPLPLILQPLKKSKYIDFFRYFLYYSSEFDDFSWISIRCALASKRLRNTDLNRKKNITDRQKQLYKEMKIWAGSKKRKTKNLDTKRKLKNRKIKRQKGVIKLLQKERESQ